MVLYLIGLGLGDEKDITLRGLEVVRGCSRVWLENYTSILGVDTAALEELYGRKVELADRDQVEVGAESIFKTALEADVALLVVGDPFCATTHTDMILRARRAGVTVKIICNASVMGAIGATGLQLYSFGQTVSIPYFDGSWRPDSFVDRILSNRAAGLHTLCLLDIKVKEPDYEALARGARNAPPLPPRFMSVAQAVEQLLEVVDARRAAAVDAGEEPVVTLDRSTLGVGCARLGQPTEQIIAATLAELCDPSADLGAPLHSLVIPAPELHELEEEYLAQFRLTPAAPAGTDGASELPPPPPASAPN